MSQTNFEYLRTHGEISMRTYNCLRSWSWIMEPIHCLEDLTKYMPEELLKIHNLGPRCLDEIVTALEKRGLSLKPSKEKARKEIKASIESKPDVAADVLIFKVMQSQIEKALYRCSLKVNQANVDKVVESTITDELSDQFQKAVTGALSKIILDRADELGLEWEHELLPVSRH